MKYLILYINIIKNLIEIDGILINFQKSCIIMKHNKSNILPQDRTILDIIYKIYDIPINYDNNMVYLGICYGSASYREAWINDKIKQLRRTLMYYQCIQSDHYRLLMLQRFFNLNKILYILKNMELTNTIITQFESFNQMIHKLINTNLNIDELGCVQVKLSMRRGGLGLKTIKHLKHISNIARLSNLTRISPFFNNNFTQSNIFKQHYNKLDNKQRIFKLFKKITNYSRY